VRDPGGRAWGVGGPPDRSGVVDGQQNGQQHDELLVASTWTQSRLHWMLLLQRCTAIHLLTCAPSTSILYNTHLRTFNIYAHLRTFNRCMALHLREAKLQEDCKGLEEHGKVRSQTTFLTVHTVDPVIASRSLRAWCRG
jgi:hypothetical protein